MSKHRINLFTKLYARLRRRRMSAARQWHTRLGSHIDLLKRDKWDFLNDSGAFVNHDPGLAAFFLVHAVYMLIVYGHWSSPWEDDFFRSGILDRHTVQEVAQMWIDATMEHVEKIVAAAGGDRSILNRIWFVPFNEPVIKDPETMKLYSDVSIAIMKLADQYGIKVIIGNWAVGNPEIYNEGDLWPYFMPALIYANAYGHALGIHEYAGSNAAQYSGYNQTLAYLCDDAWHSALETDDPYQAMLSWFHHQVNEHGVEEWVKAKFKDEIAKMTDASPAELAELSKWWHVHLFPKWWSAHNWLKLRIRMVIALYLSKYNLYNLPIFVTEAGADKVADATEVKDWIGGLIVAWKDNVGFWRRRWGREAYEFLEWLTTTEPYYLSPAAREMMRHEVFRMDSLSDEWLFLAMEIWYDWQISLDGGKDRDDDDDGVYGGNRVKSIQLFTNGSYGWGNFDISGPFHDILVRFIKAMNTNEYEPVWFG